MIRVLAFGLLALTANLCAQPAPVFPVFEMRRIASVDRSSAAVDLRAERVRLLAWLARGDAMARVQRDPLAVYGFNVASAEQGGPLDRSVRWYPRVVGKRSPSLGNENGSRLVVKLYHDGQLAAAMADDKATVVELCGVLLSEPGFDHTDIDPATVSVGADPRSGRPVLNYGMTAPRAAVYADWTETLIGEPMLMIVQGKVDAAPEIMGRIPGRGVIVGSTPPELRELSALLRGEHVLPPMPPPSGVLDRTAAQKLADDQRTLYRHVATLEKDGGPTPRFVAGRGWVRSEHDDAVIEMPARVRMAGLLLPDGASGAYVLVANPWHAALGATAASEPAGIGTGEGVAGLARVVVVDGVLRESTSGPWRYSLEVTEVHDVPK